LTGFSKVTQDITEKKQTTKALQEQAALFDLFNDAIIVRDLSGRINYWNGGAEKMYGYTQKEALGQLSNLLLKTETAKPSHKIEAELFSQGGWNGEVSQVTKDGHQIIVDSRQAIKTDEQGKSIGIVEINTNITDRKQIEQKQSALKEMERVNAELEQFASVASHDLQEPLRAIASCLHILEKTYKGRLDKDADELIDYAVEGAQRMRALINDLLSLSRIGNDQLTFSPTPVPEVIERVKTSLATSINESKATITYNGLPVLTANDTLLTQLFQNLISNAIKFRSDNPPEINIDAARENGHWLFSVRDNGIGFEQLYADRIFQPFKRLHNREQYPGSGIGLPICKRIIEKHGGEIWAESQPGKGATFNFTIKAED
jgi:PAS domain S-box-containing protein